MAKSESVSPKKALSDPKWACAMKEELKSIEKNNTWDLVNLPERKNLIGVRWVYKVKENLKGGIVKHKARLVAKGFWQRECINYDEMFAPVARIETIRLVISICGRLIDHGYQ